MMRRIFIASSVLFTAANSAKGHSHDLMLISAAGKLTLVLSDFVLEETRRNLALTQPGLTVLERIIREARIEIVSVTRKQVLDAMKWIVPKDAPILAAAKAAQVDMLVSLDKKHILDHPKLETYINTPILTPAEAFQKLKAQP
jgi:predicted nucleic acid-binding protein